MNPDSIVQTVASVGFPIVVAWYLLTQLKSTLDKNTASNVALHELLAKICTKLGISDEEAKK